MIRLKNKMHVIYDVNVIIYFLFPSGKYRISVFSEYAKKLTEFLFI